MSIILSGSLFIYTGFVLSLLCLFTRRRSMLFSSLVFGAIGTGLICYALSNAA